MSAEFAGRLKERIVIERPGRERTASGLLVAAWERVASCLAAIEPEGAGPESEAMSLAAMPRFRVVIRWRDDVAIDQRVNWRGRVLMVRQLLPDPARPEQLTLRCEEQRG